MKNERQDEDVRRAYWSEQMDAAYDFMRWMLKYPVEECGESLVSLPESVSAEGVAVEFSLTRNAGRYDRLFYLRKGLIRDFFATGHITPILNPNESLHSMEDIKEHIALALDRLKTSGEKP